MNQVTRWAALWILALLPSLPGQGISLKRRDGAVFVVEPGSLGVTLQVAGGDVFILAERLEGLGRVSGLRQSPGRAGWGLPDSKLRVEAELKEGGLIVRLRSDRARRLSWPALAGGAGDTSFIVPFAEGVRVPAKDAPLMEWIQKQGAMSATADLSMPFIGLERGRYTVTCIVPEPYYASLRVTGGSKPKARFENEWTKNRLGSRYTVVFNLSPRTPLAAAMTYREWLRREGPWRTLRKKIESNPNVARLLGAPHVYVWGNDYFSRHDVPRQKWNAFAKRLLDLGREKPGSWAARFLAACPEDARKALSEISKLRWPYRYVTGRAAQGMSRALCNPGLSGLGPKAPPYEVALANAKALAAAFPDILSDPKRWGDGVSLALLESIRAAGIDRLVVLTSDLLDARLKPHVATWAGEHGYLFGPYDSYHSIHSPDTPENDTWSTAQFDRTLYEKGRIIGLDGKPSRGFKRRGFHLSPVYARPWVEKRVQSILSVVPFSAWFVDCDAYGQFYDDANPLHKATRLEDAAARRSRLLWLSREHGLVAGSEGGTAVMVPAIHFGHGVMTPVLGWGDPRLSDRKSEFYQGRYWPPDGPDRFFKAVKLPPDYDRPWFDPRDRLPLYQAVFGDCVVTTHHWTSASLRFRDHVSTVELLELLYLVPPLYHLNRERWSKDRGRIVKHFKFWSPLHRVLATGPLIDFAWLSEDHLAQRTTFMGPKGKVHLTANFDRAERKAGGAVLPPRSITVTGAVQVALTCFRVN